MACNCRGCLVGREQASFGREGRTSCGPKKASKSLSDMEKDWLTAAQAALVLKTEYEAAAHALRKLEYDALPSRCGPGCYHASR